MALFDLQPYTNCFPDAHFASDVNDDKTLLQTLDIDPNHALGGIKCSMGNDPQSKECSVIVRQLYGTAGGHAIFFSDDVEHKYLHMHTRYNVIDNWDICHFFNADVNLNKYDQPHP